MIVFVLGAVAGGAVGFAVAAEISRRVWTRPKPWPAHIDMWPQPKP